jgi:hypothetical protein
MKSRVTTQAVVWNGGQAKTVIPAEAAYYEVVLALGSVLWVRHATGVLSCLSSVGGNVEPVVIPDRAWSEVVREYFSGD